MVENRRVSPTLIAGDGYFATRGSEEWQIDIKHLSGSRELDIADTVAAVIDIDGELRPA